MEQNLASLTAEPLIRSPIDRKKMTEWLGYGFSCSDGFDLILDVRVEIYIDQTSSNFFYFLLILNISNNIFVFSKNRND